MFRRSRTLLFFCLPRVERICLSKVRLGYSTGECFNSVPAWYSWLLLLQWKEVETCNDILWNASHIIMHDISLMMIEIVKKTPSAVKDEKLNPKRWLCQLPYCVRADLQIWLFSSLAFPRIVKSRHLTCLVPSAEAKDPVLSLGLCRQLRLCRIPSCHLAVGWGYAGSCPVTLLVPSAEYVQDPVLSLGCRLRLYTGSCPVTCLAPSAGAMQDPILLLGLCRRLSRIPWCHLSGTIGSGCAESRPMCHLACTVISGCAESRPVTWLVPSAQAVQDPVVSPGLHRRLRQSIIFSETEITDNSYLIQPNRRFETFVTILLPQSIFQTVSYLSKFFKHMHLVGLIIYTISLHLCGLDRGWRGDISNNINVNIVLFIINNFECFLNKKSPSKNNCILCFVQFILTFFIIESLYTCQLKYIEWYKKTFWVVLMTPSF